MEKVHLSQLKACILAQVWRSNFFSIIMNHPVDSLSLKSNINWYLCKSFIISKKGPPPKKLKIEIFKTFLSFIICEPWGGNRKCKLFPFSPGNSYMVYTLSLFRNILIYLTRLGLQCQTPLLVLTRLDSKVFSLKRLYPPSLVEVSKSKILGQKKIWDLNKNFGSEKKFPKKFWVWKFFFGLKKFGSKQNFGSENKGPVSGFVWLMPLPSLESRINSNPQMGANLIFLFGFCLT